MDKRDHLIGMLQDFETAMLFTRSAKGMLCGRPMALAEVQDDGTLYFCTDLDAAKVRELTADPHAAVAVQEKNRFASLSGFARIDTDRERIDRLWKDSWKLWFPRGKDDPDLCLIQFDPTEGEYWDSSGSRGLRFVVRAAKAYLEGARVEHDEEQNAQVKL